MTVSKKPNRSSTALPRVEPSTKKRTTQQRDKMTISSHLPSASSQHLPSIIRRNHQIKPNEEKQTVIRNQLMKTYEDLLKQKKRNETLIDNKQKEIEEQMREMENMLELAEKERKEAEKVTRDHAEAMKKLNDIDLENSRVMAKESEQALTIAELESTNNEMRSELRTLMDKITDTKNRIERGPDYIKEEIERFQREADELEKENEVLDVEVKRKATELNDLRIELIMKESDSEDDSDDEKDDSIEDDQHLDEPLSDSFDRITPPLTISEASKAHDTSLELKRNLSVINDQVTLPPIRPRDIHEQKSMPYQTALKSDSFLPPINGININSQTTNPSAHSRNILHRGTSAITRMPHLPRPPTSGLPPVAPRRRRMKRP